MGVIYYYSLFSALIKMSKLCMPLCRFVILSARLLCSPEQNPAARVRQPTSDCSPRPAGSKKEPYGERGQQGSWEKKTDMCNICTFKSPHSSFQEVCPSVSLLKGSFNFSDICSLGLSWVH